MRKETVSIIGVRGYPSFYGGFETAIRKLVPSLIDDGWKVRVYVRESGQKTEIINESLSLTKAWGINSKRLSTLTFGFSSMIHAAIFKSDVVLILNVANCIWLPFLKLRKIPCVVNVDGLEWQRDKWGSIAKKVFRFGAKITAKQANELIFDSQEIAKYWNSIYGRIGTYIPYGGEFRQNFNLENIENSPFLLVVSRLVPENSIDKFLDACPKIQNLIPIVIVGNAAANSSYESRIRALTKEYARISWLGHIYEEEELFKLWETATIYFHGHTVGGTNPALVQAMACGAAIIAVDTPFNREVLNDSGVFINPTPESIYSSIEELLKSPSKIDQMRDSAKSEALKRFQWDFVNSAYASLLRKAIGEAE